MICPIKEYKGLERENRDLKDENKGLRAENTHLRERVMWLKENKNFWLVQRIKLRPINEGEKEVILNTIEETKR